jgi:hypothetical protein
MHHESSPIMSSRPTITIFVLLLLSTCRTAFCQSSQSDQQPLPLQKVEADQPEQKPSLLKSLKSQLKTASYSPINSRQRVRWVLTNSIGPAHLAGGIFAAGFGTALDRPKEDGPHWTGFGERYGMRLTGIVSGNVMEAGLGATSGEDPRYFRVPDENFSLRVMNIVKQTFTARRYDGSFAPAYARFIAVPANNFLSNAWRPDSEANNHDALLRSLEGFAGRMGANAFEEFWPDVRTHVFHRNH